MIILPLFLISLFQVGYSGSKVFIISYDGYYSTKFRQSLLPKTFINEIKHRPLEYSDFDLVEIEEESFGNFSGAVSRIKEIQKISEDKTHFRNLNTFKKVSLRPSKTSSKHYLDIRQIADLIRADRLWMKGYMGEGIDIAVFDTGITRRRTFFKNIKNIYDFTNEGSSTDLIGHGTFVAGIIASSRRRCSGIAPKSNLHIYKVFTSQQVSTTSWFLDGFNMALQSKIHIINLSIGGPDFTDELFISKVQEITSNGIIIVAAIGNDGPTWGTLNNPADQGDVIGVGGINLEEKIARFSSRGMTTWELPEGYGRIKPDIVTYGTQIFGPSLYGGCRSLSGTSVAAPVVTGAVALLLSSIPNDYQRRNPAMIKQILVEGSKKLENDASMFEQGAGKLDLPASFYYLQKYLPKITFFPSYIDYLECPYMWPYCSQPIYANAISTIFNITIFNGYGVGGRIMNDPIFEAFDSENGSLLDIHLEYSDIIWPWSGYIAIFVKVKPEASTFNGTAAFQIRLQVKTNSIIHEEAFKIRLKIIPTPPKSQRLLWDQFRQMRYPPGYFARDNLEQTNSPLDWNADHPHTNFRDLYEHLRELGYYIEISGHPLTCTNLSSYSTLIIVDSEEEYFAEEILEIQNAVSNGLKLMVFADWFNSTLINKIQFLDDNNGKLWFPETGGCNIPALNSLLNVFGFAFGDIIMNGKFAFGGDNVIINFLSGSTIIQAPASAKLGYATLNDIGSELIFGIKESLKLPVFGISKYGKGMVSIFGDSNCLEDGSCFHLMDSVLVAENDEMISEIFGENLITSNLPEKIPSELLPKRITNSNFAKYSKVISSFTPLSDPVFRNMPFCHSWHSSPSHAIYNITFEIQPQNSLDVIEIERLLGPRMLSNFGEMLDENAQGLPPDDYSLSVDSEIFGPQVRSFFYFLIIFFFIGAAIVARPRSFAQFLILRPIRAFISLWFKISNYF